MIKKLCTIICLVVAIQQLQAQVVEIKPEKPQRGDKVTIIYHTDAPGAKIGKDATLVTLNFTFTRFYELPLKTIPMTKQGNDWILSFVLQKHANFASFTFQSGDIIDKPSADRHYNLKVYNGNKRVKSGYLYECYSINFEMPKSPNLRTEQLALLRKELELYPDNFEAKIFVPVVQMKAAKTLAEKQKYLDEARKLIADRLEEIPESGKNLTSVTSAYFTIGENRTDSVYKVFTQRYPKSDLAMDLKISAINKEKNQNKRVAKLEALLKENGKNEDENDRQIHEILFKHYATEGNSAKAVYHARKGLSRKSPYTPEEFMDISALLTKNKLAPDTAIAYAESSLKMVNEWPVGLIRYFPEFGYILPYVPENERAKAIEEAKSTLHSIIALNKLYVGNRKEALNLALRAEKHGSNRESLLNVSKFYEQTNAPKEAFEALWAILLKDPSDTAVIALAKKKFAKFNSSEAEFNGKVKDLEVLRNTQLKASLRNQLLNKPGPELNGITDLDGNSITKEMMKGKVVVMDFWATWCVPCMQELPYLQKVYDKYKDNPDVMFMVVNSGSNNTIKDAIGWKIKNKQYTFPIYFNNDKFIGEKVGFTVIPAIALLDKNGNMQFRTVGFEGAEVEHKLAAEIDILLESK